MEEANPNYACENGVLFTKDKAVLIKYPIGNERTSYVIPNSVTTIGNGAFNGCDSLTSVEIPDSVTTIGNSAFYLCTELTNIAIPDSVITIGDGAFYSCDILTCVEIGANVTTIGDGAFYDCKNLTSITIPASVTTIGDDTFTYCSYLIIYGYADTFAHTYATRQGIKFVSLEDTPVPHVHKGSAWDTNDTEHWHVCYCGETFDKASHLGGTATCFAKAACTVCGKTYGFADSANHVGGTEIRNYVASTATTEGYTGDTYCSGCNKQISSGTVIPAYTVGDITGDNSIDISDALALFQHCLMPDLYPITYLGNIDFTKDGKLDISDALHLFRYSMFPDLYPLT